MMFHHGFTKIAGLKPDVELQPHQKRVAKGGSKLVYHGLGSGKSLTSLAATQGMKTDVMLPAALRENYRKEVKKYTTGHNPNIMSFEKAVTTPIGSAEALVIDEGHNLGRIESKRSKAILERAPKYKKRLVLSGTPIRNHPSEIAPLMNIVRGDSAFPTDQKAFSERFVAENKIEPGFFNRVFHGAKPGVSYSIKNPKEFKQLVDGYVDYHKPSSENFPSVSHEVIETPMSEEQLKYYTYILGKAGPALRWKISQGMPPSKTESKQLNAFLSGARQVSNSTKAFGGTETSPKITKAVDELVKRNEKDKNFKAVIYSNYLESGVNDYSEQLKKKNIPHVIFDGSLSDKKRKEMVDNYNAGKIKAILITGAGAQGIDLKGTKLMQLLEPHWNDARLEQAAGRAIRYKSHEHLPKEERHVEVQRFHSTVPKSFLQRLTGSEGDKSTDQYLDMLSKEKEKLNEQFLGALRDVGSAKK